jgi:hypothetical protein
MKSRPITLSLYGALLLAFVVVAGCKDDSAQKDVVAYVNGYVKDVTPLETQAIAATNDALRGIQDFKTVSMSLKAAAGKFKDAFDKGRKLEVGNADLQAIHTAHLKAVEGYMTAVNQLSTGFQNGAVEDIKKGKDALDAADKAYQDSHKALKEFGASHGVEWSDSK